MVIKSTARLQMHIISIYSLTQKINDSYCKLQNHTCQHNPGTYCDMKDDTLGLAAAPASAEFPIR